MVVEVQSVEVCGVETRLGVGHESDSGMSPTRCQEAPVAARQFDKANATVRLRVRHEITGIS
jgi:hypothetical protein